MLALVAACLLVLPVALQQCTIAVPAPLSPVLANPELWLMRSMGGKSNPETINISQESTYETYDFAK